MRWPGYDDDEARMWYVVGERCVCVCVCVGGMEGGGNAK